MATQLTLELPKVKGAHGGRREGAGRPPKKGRRNVPHRARPWHDACHPVHVTLRIVRGLHMRRWASVAVIGETIRKASTAEGAAAKRRETFRVVHFSVQKDHVHLIVEASSKNALGRGMQGLTSRLARAVNRKL